MKRIWGFITLVLLILMTGCQVNPAERNDAGVGLYHRGDYPMALNAYQAAQVAAPDQAEPYYNAASAYAGSGDLEKAVAALEQALRTANEDLAAQAYYNLGNVYFQMRRFDEAVRAYQQALLRHPDDEDARHNLELALKQIVLPTPTPAGQPSTPTPDQGSGQSTPSPSPEAASATPTPQPDNADQGNPATPPPENTLTAEEAESLLDAVQRDQHTLQEFLNAPVSGSSGKDW